MKCDPVTVQLALKLDLPVPIDAFGAWAGKTKTCEWANSDGLQKFAVNGSTYVHADEFAAFLKRKFHLRQAPPDDQRPTITGGPNWSATDSETAVTLLIAAAMDLPLPIRFFQAWAGRSKIFEWRNTDGVPVHEVNGHSCIYADEFAVSYKRKFALRPFVGGGQAADKAA